MPSPQPPSSPTKSECETDRMGLLKPKFVCDHDGCLYTTTAAWKLQRHQVTHETHKAFGCPVKNCRFRTRTENARKEHLARIHSQKKPIACPFFPVCPQRFKVKHAVYQHLLIIHRQEEKRLKCPHCDYNCVQHHSMKSHVRTHTGEKPYACTLCDYRGRTSWSLKGHISAIHTGEKHFNCQFCEFTSSHRNSIISHHRSCHSQNEDERKPFKCPEDGCGFACGQKSNLNTHHKLMHTNLRPFQCDHPGCQYKAKSRSTLKLHLRIHTGEKPYACHYQMCPYRTTQSSHLKTHIKSHEKKAQPSKYKCPYCSYRSRDRDEDKLRDHLKRCTNAPLHPKTRRCDHDQCLFRCQTRTGLSRHVTEKHSNSQICKNGKREKNKKKKMGTTRTATSHFCTLCKFSLNSEPDLAIHFNDMHGLPKVVLHLLG